MKNNPKEQILKIMSWSFQLTHVLATESRKTEQVVMALEAENIALQMRSYA